jgi:hypothetical protein
VADRRVPLGISVITILMYIGAIVDIAAGVFMLIESGPVAEAADVSESVITGTGIAAIVFGIVIGLLAFGLRSASKGVRLIIGVVMALRIAGAIYMLIALPGARFEGLATGIVAIVVLYLLYGNEESKAFFDGAPMMT